MDERDVAVEGPGVVAGHDACRERGPAARKLLDGARDRVGVIGVAEQAVAAVADRRRQAPDGRRDDRRPVREALLHDRGLGRRAVGQQRRVGGAEEQGGLVVRDEAVADLDDVLEPQPRDLRAQRRPAVPADARDDELDVERGIDPAQRLDREVGALVRPHGAEEEQQQIRRAKTRALGGDRLRGRRRRELVRREARQERLDERRAAEPESGDLRAHLRRVGDEHVCAREDRAGHRRAAADGVVGKDVVADDDPLDARGRAREEVAVGHRHHGVQPRDDHRRGARIGDRANGGSPGPRIDPVEQLGGRLAGARERRGVAGLAAVEDRRIQPLPADRLDGSAPAQGGEQQRVELGCAADLRMDRRDQRDGCRRPFLGARHGHLSAAPRRRRSGL